MFAEWARKWLALVLGAVVLSTGCVTVMPPAEHGAFRHQGGRVRGTELAMVSPAGMAVRAVASGARQVDAFEHLLLLAGLDNAHDEPPRGVPLTPQEAARVLAVLLTKPVTLGSFPPRMAICHLLREVLEGGEVSREELLRRVERFKSDSLAALRRLPAGVAALIASSPQYLERFRYMTRGEQVKAVSKLLTHLIVTFGTAGGTTGTLTRTVGGLEATVPVLSLSAEGLLMVERVVVPVGKVATVLSGGPGAAIILQRANASGKTPSPAAGPGQWGPAKESMSARSRAYQEQISGHSADEAYWVGGTSTKDGGVRFDGFKDGVLVEAKGPGYANKFFETLEPRPWFKHSGAKALVDQAKRQLEAAMKTGTPIRWHIAEEKIADAIRRLFKLEKVAGIEVVYTPAL
jgi:restriction endonuclease fold toxin 5 of polymorphic toxin system